MSSPRQHITAYNNRVIRKRRQTHRPSRRVDARILMLMLCLLSFGMFFVNPYEYEQKTLLLALTVFWFGAFPVLIWFYSKGKPGIPIFEGYMLFSSITFGFAGFMAQKSTLTARHPVTPNEWDVGLLVVCLSLICSALGYYFYRGVTAKSTFKSTLPFELKISGIPDMIKILMVMLVAGYAIKGYLPSVLSQILQSFLLYTNIILLIAAFGNQVSSEMRKLILYVLTPLNALVFSSFSGAAIYGLFASLVPVAMAYYLIKEKVPWLFIISMVIVFIVLQPIKGEYRSLAWTTGTTSAQGFIGFAYDRVIESSEAGTSLSEWLEDAFRRLNHLHVTAAVIADTPDVVPFQKGATYKPLIYKLVPRFIWPEKPTEALGNSWAHLYGYLYRYNFTTSFNLPFITEMYMNFGLPGIVITSLLIGVVMGWLSRRYWTGGNSILICAFGILIGLPFLTPESNLSLLAGRAIIGAVTVYASLFVLSISFPSLVVRRAHKITTRMNPNRSRRN